MSHTELPGRFSHLSPLKRALLAVDELQERLATVERAHAEPIAIIGMGCRFPGGVDSPDALWDLLAAGRCAVSDVPPGRWDAQAIFDPNPDVPGKTYVRRAAFLDQVDQFEPEAFAIAPREAVAMDPQQRLLLEVTRDAFEDAGYAPDRLSGSATGVFVGIAAADYGSLLHSQPLERIDAYFASGMAQSMASGRLSYVFGLQGPSLSIDTACSSSLVAVHAAVQSLRIGECRMAVAGGVSLMLTPHAMVLFAKSRMLSPDGLCRTFDAAADGFGRGEGCGVIVLKRLADAVAEGDRILAVIRGSAVNQDGPSSGLTAPNGPAQEAVIRQALRNAGAVSAEVGYVEAHGTGTLLGDPIEVQALGRAYGAGRSAATPLLIGSIKTNVGHLEAAAGIAGLAKIVLAVSRRQLPPHLHFVEPNPHVPWDRLPVEVVSRRRSWPVDAPLAAVSSFGFSGTNVHVIVGGAPSPTEDSRPVLPLQLVTVSARTAAGLRRRLEDLNCHLETSAAEPLCDIAVTANVGRAALGHRAALRASSRAELREGIAALLSGDGSTHGRLATLRSPDPPPVAFLFTGQGSQYPGMGRVLYDRHPLVRAALDECSARLADHGTPGLLDAMFGRAEAGAIHDTRWTQPALFALEYAVAQLWLSWGIRPAALLGHSLGELVAAAVAGVLSLEDALRLVATRAALMSKVRSGGAMAALEATAPVAAALLAPVKDAVVIAAENAPTEVVISGRRAAVDGVIAAAERLGIRAKRLPVSQAFHSPSMDVVVEPFGEAAAALPFAEPRIPVVSNVTGRFARPSELCQPEYWRRHLREPVRFEAGVRALAEQGIATFIEVGPSPTLLALTARTVERPDVDLIASIKPGRDDWAQMSDAVASAYLRGLPVDWRAFHQPHRGRVIRLPSTPFERRHFWIDAPRPSPAAGAGAWQGRRTESPIFAGAVFDLEVSNATHAELYEHRVRGLRVAPATALIEVIRVNAAAYLEGDVDLCDIAFSRPLQLEAEARTLIQVALTPAGGGLVATLCSRAAGASSAQWTRHVEARVERPAVTTAPRFSLEQIRARCSSAVAPGSHYESLAARGLELGAPFRVIESITVGDGEALARLHPASASAASPELSAHWLDGAIQTIAPALADRIDPHTAYLPFAARRCRLDRSAARARWAHVVLRADGSDSVEADVTWLDDAGDAVGTIERLALRPAMPRSGGEAGYFVPEWQEVPTGPVPAEALVVSATARFEQQVSDCGVDYEQSLNALDALADRYVERALCELGWSARAGERVRLEGLAGRLGISDRHARLLATLLANLAAAGVLARDGDEWIVKRPLSSADVDADAGLLERDHPELRAELTLLTRCGRSLAGVLRGDESPLEVLFPGGDPADVERLYSESAPAALFNRAAADLLASAYPGGLGGRRILEVGGGTGATTAAIRGIADGASEFRFTDVSPTLVARAARRFREWAAFSASVLDLDREPEAQGFDRAAYDVVIATNVLHATADLQRTLERLRRLLAPGGLLIAVEVVRRQHWIDMTFGLTPGWWAFTDVTVRWHSPLVSSDTWKHVLRRAGYDEVECLPPVSAGSGIASLQTTLVARAPGHPDVGEAEIIVHAETAAEAEAFIAAACLPPARARSMTPLDGLEGLSSCERLVFLAPDSPVTADVAPLDRQRAVLGRLLECIQAIASSSRPGARCVVATRGALAATTNQRVNLVHAPVAGLMASVCREHPGVRWVHVDLDPDDVRTSPARVVAELKGDSAEPVVAYRQHLRLAPRLVPLLPALRGERRLQIGQRGVLDTAQWAAMRAPLPGPGQVRIRVRAAGLNFKDVLHALGTLADTAGSLGFECAGTIDAVGAGVEEFVHGDEVLAIAAGGLATAVIAEARFVAHKPSAWSFDEAAAFPVAFVTAQYALGHVARIGPGDRVLVHSAAGGVGGAAVQLVRAAGAEVLATAGSDAKRRLLRGQGVAHVFDSRSTDFADEILAATDGRGVTAILNALGDGAIGASLRALATGGWMLEIGKKDSWSESRVAEVRPDVRYRRLDWSDPATADSALVGDLLRTTVERYRSAPMPLRTTVYEAGDAAGALRRLASGGSIGKLVVRPPASEPTAPIVHPDATYLVTGGLSGLGLATAAWLVARGAAHLVLVGRRPPSEEAAVEIGRLRAGGVRLKVVRCDVADPRALERAYAEAMQDLPPIKGVVHSAGTLEDATLTRQTWASFERVLGPKVTGAWTLHRLTTGCDLDFFVVYSSIASVVGAPGQANHAAANAFLDALAYERRRIGLPALTVNWGIWSGIGAAERRGIARRAVHDGIGVLTPDRGFEALSHALATGGPQVIVADVSRHAHAAATTGEPARGMRADAATPPDSGRAVHGALRLRLQSTPAARRERVAIDYVSEAASRVLATDRSPDEQQPFRDLGLDSLMAVELRNVIAHDLGDALPATLLFDYPTVAAVAGFLLQRLFPEDAVAATRPDGLDASGTPLMGTEALGEVEALSDEEVDRLFAQRLGGAH
jgi:acyl transferase domain-containing protein/NADPH:quinone reductase-like Zn-dependent oxidoreductase/SAM-dependent methyltransferase/acyl carrier protein